MKNAYPLAVLAVLSLATPSVAAMPGLEAQKVIVSAAGLDLTTAKGAKLLDLRIAHAASSLCGMPSSSDALGWKAFRDCRNRARATAAEQRRTTIALASKRRQDAIVSAR